jgi:PAS domain S-box-containing protein
MKKYRILYIEDNPTDFEMVKAILEEGDVLEELRRVEKREELIDAIGSYDFDLILTDYSLPVFHGLEAIKIAVQLCPQKPIIMITGTLPDEVAVDVIRKGAWDYVLKENVYRLIPSINSAMERLLMQQEKAAALEALKEREENYRILAESSPYGIIVHTSGKIVYHNNQAIRIFREKDDISLNGIKLADYVHPQYMATIAKRMKTLYAGKGDPKPIEIKFLNSKKEEIILEVASSPITFNGAPSGQVIFSDIAERKRMEADLIRAKDKAEESDRLKTIFLENLSHEIRTPLNGIIGFTSLLKNDALTEDDKNNYIQIVEESGRHLLTIIDDLIEVSRIEANQVELHQESFNINELLEELSFFFNENIRFKENPVVLGLSKPLKNEESYIQADKARLRQILFNLLSNAFKFTSVGRIDFGYEVSGKEKLLFYVKDTGIGIPEEAQEIVFERFRQADESTTRKYGGNGLGLTISKGLVEAMGGKIWLSSRENQGTEFYFELPFRTFTSIPEKGKARGVFAGNYNWTGKKVLVAEDEASNFYLLQHILDRTGAEVHHVTSGEDVLEKLGDGNTFDLLLLDIKMPGMDGIMTVKMLRDKKISIPVIAQTAYAMSQDRQKCIDAGCDDYITKPIKSKELLSKIDRFLGKLNI